MNLDVTDGSLVEWQEEVPLNTQISIYTAVTDSSTVVPEIWGLASNGSSIPGIEAGQDLSGKYLWTKQELSTSDSTVTPRLSSLTESITQSKNVAVSTSGYRISSSLDISGEGIVKNSQIFWQADTRKDDNIVIETNVHVGELALGWFEVQNGGSVSGLERGVDLSNISIKTRATFNGGPDFYPRLNNINIFIEI